MTLPTLKKIGTLTGKKILLRVDLNEPLTGNRIQDDFRLQRIMPTLEFLHNNGAKTLVLSHAESESEKMKHPSLRYVYEYFNKTFPSKFIEDIWQAKTSLQTAANGSLIFTENIRRYDEERQNDDSFTNKLASDIDIYVNDAFSVSHREHASIVGLPRFVKKSCIGILFEEEINILSKAFKPDHPFLLVLGGSKIETKIPIINKYSEKADYVFIGGIPANNILKAKGFEIGQSVHSENCPDVSQLIENKKIILPIDAVVSNEKGRETKKIGTLDANDKILDLGEATLKRLSKIVNESKLVVWNGPFGKYEIGFYEGTKNFAKLLAQSDAFSIIGGGDTIAAIHDKDTVSKMKFISTAGGAMLDFLANETLPGIEAIKNANRK